MHHDIAKVLIGSEQIAARVRELGQRIAADLEGELRKAGHPADGEGKVVIMPILTGSIFFVADLVRHMPLKISMRMVTVSSYPGQSTESKGARLRGELPGDLSGKHVLIIDDILDSGQTLGLVRDLVEDQGAASVRVAVLLKKPTSRRVREVSAEYVGFEIPDEFVVGYGLDYDGYYRNLPSIATLTPDAISARGRGADA
jgi:hypoxanthine phosphoribosyltransferase